jgi:hypothetical protein
VAVDVTSLYLMMGRSLEPLDEIGAGMAQRDSVIHLFNGSVYFHSLDSDVFFFPSEFFIFFFPLKSFILFPSLTCRQRVWHRQCRDSENRHAVHVPLVRVIRQAVSHRIADCAGGSGCRRSVAIAATP